MPLEDLKNLRPAALDPPHGPGLPLNALRAFDAAARRGGVAGAAEELGVTSGAVSQQIRQLETLIGAKLVRRAGRGLALTAEGQEVAVLIAEPFARLREASALLTRRTEAGVVRLGAPGPFALRWIAPRLARFEERAGVRVRLVADPEPAALARRELDLMIRHAPVRPVGGSAIRLMTDAVVAVGAPALAGGAEADRWRELVRTARLVHYEPPGGPPGGGWPAWLGRRGIRRDELGDSDRCASLDALIAAAVAGRGLALVPAALVEAERQSGALIALMAAGVEAGESGYDLVWPEGGALRGLARDLRSFLAEESRPYETSGV